MARVYLVNLGFKSNGGNPGPKHYIYRRPCPWEYGSTLYLIYNSSKHISYTAEVTGLALQYNWVTTQSVIVSRGVAQVSFHYS